MYLNEVYVMCRQKKSWIGLDSNPASQVFHKMVCVKDKIDA